MALQFLSYKLKWVIYKRPKSFLQFNIVTDFSTGYTSPSYLRFYRAISRFRRPPSRLLLADRKWKWRYNFYPVNSSGSFTNDLSHFYNSISSPTSAPGTQVRRTFAFTGFATLAAGRKWIWRYNRSFLQFNIVTDFSTDRPHACCWPTGSGYGVTISIL
jgi:hypothetical protein